MVLPLASLLRENPPVGKRVFVCYENNSIPENRIVNEVWRASETSEKGSNPLSSEMKSEAIFSCYEAVKTSKNFQEALQKFNNKILETKSNSIVAEFAKHVIRLLFRLKILLQNGQTVSSKRLQIMLYLEMLPGFGVKTIVTNQ